MKFILPLTNVGVVPVRLRNTKSLQVGDKLAKTIYNEHGVALVQRGIHLSEKMIQHLIRQDIRYVYLEDELTNDIMIDQMITDDLRMEVIETIKDTFAHFEEHHTMEKAFIHDDQMQDLTSIIDQILTQMSRQQEDAISLLADLFITDDYTFQHSLNVTIYTLAIGMKLNYSKKELGDLGLGALLHDIGKVFIDKSILLKPGPLEPEEYEIMKSHTELGFTFIRKNTNLSSVIAHCAYQHHERLDGSGYPRQLTEKEIHPYGKIIAIADVFDAVTSDRVYREGMLPHEGLEILYAEASSKFDLEMVEAFKKSVAIYPTGLTVTLSDNRTGVIIGQNPNYNDRPNVRILQHQDHLIKEPYEVNLSKVFDVVITSCHL